MRVGLNISAASESSTGVGNYAFQLAKNVVALAPADEWFLLGANTHVAPLLEGANVQATVTQRKGLARILWEQTGLPFEARRLKIDLLHGADFSRPLAYAGPMVNTIHDISPFVDSRYFSPVRRMYKRVVIRHAIRRSSAIVTVSEFSRRQIMERFSLDGSRVFAIALGVAQGNGVPHSSTGPPSILFVGNLEHRKNLVRLVEAFRLLRERRRIPHRLILAGKPGYGWEEIRAAIGKGGLQECVDVPGYVSNESLAKLYPSAELFVFPSVYEGFGLPVLEAMACGTPVACSSAASLPEVGGDAVEYFDPLNVEEMAAAMERVLHSPGLRAEMREKGLKQAAKFTWEDCARQHLEVYRRVLAK